MMSIGVERLRRFFTVPPDPPAPPGPEPLPPVPLEPPAPAPAPGTCTGPGEGACWRCELYPWPSGCGPRVAAGSRA